MFERAKYKDSSQVNWRQLKDPVASIKRDGANFFLHLDSDGSLRFFSRRPSVTGTFPERTSQLPHLTKKKMPEYANQTYNVELVHTGSHKSENDNHSMLTGILVSKPERSIATQQTFGPVRVAIHNVISPDLPTYRDKLLHSKQFEKDFGNTDILWVEEPVLGHRDIDALIHKTLVQNREGVVVTSLDTPEPQNVRIKIKHKIQHNLQVAGIEQELDKNKVPKQAAGALILKDAEGKMVGKVGTGFTRELREEIWNNPTKWVGRLIQVTSRGIAKNSLKEPVFNGDADGDLDVV